MKNNYAASLAEVLKWEGGWSNNPADPGGATMKGVTQRVFDAYLARNGKANRSVRTITDSELQDIYRKQYWDAVRGDELPSGLDFAVFDFAVNSGPIRAIHYLQTVLGVATDSNIGQVTLQAASAADPKKTVNALCDKRLAFLKNLSTWGTFGKGWASRVAGVRTKAIEMASQAPVAPIVPDPVPVPPPAQNPAPEPSKPVSDGQNIARWVIGFFGALGAAFAYWMTKG